MHLVFQVEFQTRFRLQFNMTGWATPTPFLRIRSTLVVAFGESILFDKHQERIIAIHVRQSPIINVNSKCKLFGPKEPALLLMLHSANDDLVNRLTQTKCLLIDILLFTFIRLTVVSFLPTIVDETRQGNQDRTISLSPTDRAIPQDHDNRCRSLGYATTASLYSFCHPKDCILLCPQDSS